LKQEISVNELYAPEDLKNRLKKRKTENRQRRWDLGINEMKERKKSIQWSNEMSGFQRREQVILSRLRTGYTRATHRQYLEREIIPVCPQCKTRLTLDHFLWECEGTKAEKDQISINKVTWQTRLTGLAKLMEYTKKYSTKFEEQQGPKDTYTTRHWKPKNESTNRFNFFHFIYFLFLEKPLNPNVLEIQYPKKNQKLENRWKNTTLHK
jgi:hypothetical protein